MQQVGSTVHNQGLAVRWWMHQFRPGIALHCSCRKQRGANQAVGYSCLSMGMRRLCAPPSSDEASSGLEVQSADMTDEEVAWAACEGVGHVRGRQLLKRACVHA